MEDDDTIIDGTVEWVELFSTMSERRVRLWVRALLPTPGERKLFDALTDGVSKPEVDLVGAQSLARVRLFGR